MVVYLHKIFSEIWTNWEWSEEGLENLHLYWGDWNNIMEQMFISGYIDGWNQRLYQKYHKFYSSTVQAISIRAVDWATKVVAMCDRFVDMEAPVKKQV